MKGIKKNIEAYLNDNAGKIINEMGKKKGDTFSTHDFIKQLRENPARESEYTEWLSKQKSKTTPEGAVNSQIGIYLSKRAEFLDIEDKGLKNKEEGHEWEKTKDNI